MRTGLNTLLLAILLSTFSHAQADTAWSGNFNVLVGGKNLAEDSFEEDQHAEFGFMLDITPPGWVVSLAIDGVASYGEDTEETTHATFGLSDVTEQVYSSEFDVGIRKAWQAGKTMHPYIGGGLALMSLTTRTVIEPDNASYTVYEDDEDGTGAGFWIDTGIYWTFDHFNIGVDLRVSRGEVEINNIDYEAGGNHMAILAGYHW